MSNDYYARGEWNFRCDECFQKCKSSEARLRFDNARVCARCWEPRHPQDFVRAVPDLVAPPWTRPDSELFLENNGQPTVTVTPPPENGVQGNVVVLGRVDPATLVATL